LSDRFLRSIQVGNGGEQTSFLFFFQKVENV